MGAGAKMHHQEVRLADGHKAGTHEYGYAVIFEKKGDAYTATVPALNYSSTYGETLDEAREMVKEMIGLYLKSLRADGLELPERTLPKRPLQNVSASPRSNAHIARRLRQGCAPFFWRNAAFTFTVPAALTVILKHPGRPELRVVLLYTAKRRSHRHVARGSAPSGR